MPSSEGFHRSRTYTGRTAPCAVSVMLTTTSARSFNCRFCSVPLRTTFVDLGMSPLCQTHIAPEQLDEMERRSHIFMARRQSMGARK